MQDWMGAEQDAEDEELDTGGAAGFDPEAFPTLFPLLQQSGAELEEAIAPLDPDELMDAESDLDMNMEPLIGIVQALPEELVQALVLEAPEDYETAQALADALEISEAVTNPDTFAGFIWHASMVAQATLEGEEEGESPEQEIAEDQALEEADEEE
jgi:hypothetical protein